MITSDPYSVLYFIRVTCRLSFRGIPSRWHQCLVGLLVHRSGLVKKDTILKEDQHIYDVKI